MLPKRHRLTQSKDIGRVRRYGKRAGDQLLTLYVLPARSADVRVGFSVSKRVGKAVVRNKVKRRLRESIRHELPRTRRGQDILVVARPAAAFASYHELSQAVQDLLKCRGALCAPDVPLPAPRTSMSG